MIFDVESFLRRTCSNSVLIYCSLLILVFTLVKLGCISFQLIVVHFFCSSKTILRITGYQFFLQFFTRNIFSYSFVFIASIESIDFWLSVFCSSCRTIQYQLSWNLTVFEWTSSAKYCWHLLLDIFSALDAFFQHN